MQERIVARPVSGDQSLVTFTNLKVGTLTLTGIAYPNADGTGIAQARGSTPVAIQSGQTATVTLTMNSTIDHLEITPDPASVAVGAIVGLTATAKDASGSVVLTTASKLQWDTGNHALATVDASGNVTGVAAGSTQVTVTETESGKSKSVALSVTGRTTSIDLPVVSGSQGQTINLPCTLTCGGAAVTNKQIAFSVDGLPVGNATTDATGVASLPYVIAQSAAVGAHSVTASFAGDATYASATITADALTVLAPSSLIAYDGFDYAPDTIVHGLTGGVGWATAWNEHGPSTHPVVVAGSLSFGNLKTSGNSIQTTSFDPIGVDRYMTETIGTPGTTVYFSFLVRALESIGSGVFDPYFGLSFDNLQYGKPGSAPDFGIEREGGRRAGHYRDRRAGQHNLLPRPARAVRCRQRHV